MKSYQNKCLVDVSNIVDFYDTLVTPHDFRQINVAKLWAFNHDDDKGSPPLTRAWLRDRPTDDGLVDRTALVFLYETPPDSGAAGWYRIFFARGHLTPVQAGRLAPWRAPGAPGFDPQLMPPRVYPDSLRVELQEPITKFGADAYGRTRGWTIRPLRAPVCPP